MENRLTKSKIFVKSILGSLHNPDFMSLLMNRLPGNRKYFNIDMHISVIRDVDWILSKYFDDSELITNWSLSRHSQIVGKRQSATFHVTPQSFPSLTLADIEKFSNLYAPFLKQYSGFIVTFSPIFALMYERFDKPIFVVNAARYEVPLSWTKNFEEWETLNVRLKKMYDSGQMKVVSNNLVDKEYLYDLSGLTSQHIPSLCIYDNIRWSSDAARICSYGSESNCSLTGIHSVRQEFGSPYEISVFNSIRALVCIPYEVSTMSLFEQYNSGIPLVMPSLPFLSKLVEEKKIGFSGNYMSLEADSSVPTFLEPNVNVFTPNGFVQKYIHLADYYQPTVMPHVVHFDSFEELKDIIATTDFTDVHDRQEHFLSLQRSSITNDFGLAFESHMR